MTNRILFWMEEKIKFFLVFLVVCTAGSAGAQKMTSCHCACVNGEVKRFVRRR